MSIKFKQFPDDWKIATIVSLYKGGKKDEVSNYRPVSLLPVVGKILEKIIHIHINEYFEKNNILCSYQGGFRKNHSTLNTITNFTSDIFDAINNKETTIATFFDLKKAFDTVNHTKLINKLKKMGIKGDIIELIENYLSKRYQKTICNNKISSTKRITCGVPQGSILGPLLFLVYINDIENILCDVKFQLYADDTVIYLSGKNTMKVKETLQKNINKFVEWCEINKLTINIRKTKVMVFGTRHFINKSKNIELSIGKELLQSVPTYKYLGINLDQTLNYNYHLKSIVGLISHKLFVFSKIRRYFDEFTALTIYKTMILPYFDYGDVIFMFANDTYLNNLGLPPSYPQ